jgi:2'-phosphotransferase
VDLLIYVDLPKAMAAGVKFFKSTNNVVLTRGLHESGVLPAMFFQRAVRRWRNGKVSEELPLPCDTGAAGAGAGAGGAGTGAGAGAAVAVDVAAGGTTAAAKPTRSRPSRREKKKKAEDFGDSFDDLAIGDD